MPTAPKKTFEELIDVIDAAIWKHRSEWTLTAIQWMDYSDVGQIIRMHVLKKWDLWDQSRPIEPWLHVTIRNQISNLIRNIYYNHARPCLKCAAAEGDNLCHLFTIQCEKCPLYAKWLKTKKPAYDVKIPLSMEFHINEVNEKHNHEEDIEDAIALLHDKIFPLLTKREREIYNLLYIEQEPEDQVIKQLAEQLGKSKNFAYKEVRLIKDSIFVKAKQLVYEGEIDF